MKICKNSTYPRRRTEDLGGGFPWSIQLRAPQGIPAWEDSRILVDVYISSYRFI